MNRGDSVFYHGSILMVINDLHVIGIALAPFKTNTPLVVDTNTVLALTVARQFFRWLAGGIRKSCNVSAPSSSSSFRRAPRWMSCGSLRENWRRNNFAVSSSLKLLIMGLMITQAVMIVERYYVLAMLIPYA